MDLKKKVLLFSFLVYFFRLISISCFAEESRGTVSGLTLRQGVGARSFGMGEAYVAVSDDINALFSNPAGLAIIQKKELTTMYFKGLADVQTGFLGYVVPWEKRGNLAMGFLYLNGGRIKINYLDGNSHSYEAQRDYVGILSYARDINDSFFIGGNVKLLHSTLVEEYTAQAVSVDLGIMYKKLMHNNLSIGFTVQNIGKGIKYSEGEDDLPFTLKGGIAYKLDLEGNKIYPGFFNEVSPISNRLPGCLFSLEVEKPKEKEIKGKLGFEYGKYWKQHRYLLRGGYKLGYTPDTYTLGIGCEFEQFQFDYGIGIMDDLGLLHKVSFTIRFSA
jgi:hypothetical protein